MPSETADTTGDSELFDALADADALYERYLEASSLTVLTDLAWSWLDEPTVSMPPGGVIDLTRTTQ